jgi:chromosome segregation ATPase
MLALVLSLEEQVNENEQRIDNAMRNLVELARAVRSMVLKVEEQQSRSGDGYGVATVIGPDQSGISDEALGRLLSDHELMIQRLSALELSQQQTELELAERHSALEQRLELLDEDEKSTSGSLELGELIELVAELGHKHAQLSQRVEALSLEQSLVVIPDHSELLLKQQQVIEDHDAQAHQHQGMLARHQQALVDLQIALGKLEAHTAEGNAGVPAVDASALQEQLADLEISLRELAVRFDELSLDAATEPSVQLSNFEHDLIAQRESTRAQQAQLEQQQRLLDLSRAEFERLEQQVAALADAGPASDTIQLGEKLQGTLLRLDEFETRLAELDTVEAEFRAMRERMESAIKPGGGASPDDVLVEFGTLRKLVTDMQERETLRGDQQLIHRTEMKVHAEAVTKLQQTLDAQQKLIQGHHETLDNMKKKVDMLANNSATQADQAYERWVTVEQGLAALRAQQEALEEHQVVVEQQQAEINKVQQSVSALLEKDSSGAAEALVRWTALEDQLKGAVERTAAVDETLKSHSTYADIVKELENRLDKLETGVDSDEQRAMLVAINEKFTSQQVAFAELQQKLEAQGAIAATLQQRLDELSSGRTSYEDQLASAMKELRDQLDSLRSEQAELQVQLSKVGHHDTAISELQKRLELLNQQDTVSGVQSQLLELAARQDSSVSALVARVDELALRDTEVAALSLRLDELAGQIELATKQELSAIRARVEDLASSEAGVASLSARIDKLASESDNQLRKIEQRIDDLAGQDTAVGELRSKLDELVKQAEENLLKVELRVEELAAKDTGVGELRQRMEELAQSTNLDELRQSFESLQAAQEQSLSAVNQQLKDAAGLEELIKVEERIDGLKSAMAELQSGQSSALSELSKQLSELSGRDFGVSDLGSRIDELAQYAEAVRRLESRLDDLASADTGVGELQLRLDKLAMEQQEFAALRDRVEVLAQLGTASSQQLDAQHLASLESIEIKLVALEKRDASQTEEMVSHWASLEEQEERLRAQQATIEELRRKLEELEQRQPQDPGFKRRASDEPMEDPSVQPLIESALHIQRREYEEAIRCLEAAQQLSDNPKLAEALALARNLQQLHK